MIMSVVIVLGEHLGNHKFSSLSDLIYYELPELYQLKA